MNVILAASSGITTPISCPLNPDRPMSSFSVSRTAEVSEIFFSERDTERACCGRYDDVLAATLIRDELTPPTMTCFEVNSQSHSGRCARNIWVMGSRRLLVN